MPAYANGQRFVSKGGLLRERYSDPDAFRSHADLTILARLACALAAARAVPLAA